MKIYVIKAALLTISVSLLVGCAPSVGSILMEANRQDNERAIARGKGLLAEHLKLIEKLRAEGDPMGDYLWTQANADAWVPNPIKDPLVLKKMYEDAAAKGSVDSQHVLGLMLFDGATSRTECVGCPVLKAEDRDWRKGLSTIEEASKKQCFYWGIVLDGMAGRSCLIPMVPAREIWPNFRDGTGVPKSDEQASRWNEMKLACQAQIKALPIRFFFSQKFPACR